MIPRGAVVYADPPYAGTDGYFCIDWKPERFAAWLRNCSAPVYVSEYRAPAPGMYEAETWRHQARYSGTGNTAVTERLFCTRPVARMYQPELFA